MSLAYVGGKFRQSKVWAPKILELTEDRTRYVEPFVGGASMLEKLAPKFTEAFAGDLNEDLVLMWEDVKSGAANDYPVGVTAKDHADLKAGIIHTGYRAFVGFGCSFAGMWFATYHDGAAKTKRAILKTHPHIQNVTFRHQSYQAWAPLVEKGTVVYCDPPYAGTMRFKANEEHMNYDMFWDIMRTWRDAGAHVFVSEYNAPPDWTCVSELDLAKTVSSTKKGQRQLDKLWK